jgi:hypothetical protein
MVAVYIACLKPSKLIQAIKLLTYIWQVLGSNLDGDTEFP